MSSWLIRLAQANGQSIHAFFRAIWPQTRLAMLDLDRLPPSGLLAMLSDRTGVDLERIQGLTLRTWTGRLMAAPEEAGSVLPWWLPLRASSCGEAQRFCPACLAEGDTPFLRLHWRLGFTVGCEVHGRVLLDACPFCGRPFRLLQPWRVSWAEAVLPVSVCRLCGMDVRRLLERGMRWERQLWNRVDPGALHMQARCFQALETGWSDLREDDPVHSVLFFAGLRQILRVLASRGVAGRVRRVGETMGAPVKGLPACQGRRFELWSPEARMRGMGLAEWLLEAWPNRFVDLARQARITANLLLEDRRDAAPYWVWRVARENLMTLYAPWRDANRPKWEQLSYAALGRRKFSARLAAQERRIEFVRAHPELWSSTVLLAQALKDAGLYSQGTCRWDVVRHCPKLLSLARAPNEWWRRVGKPSPPLEAFSATHCCAVKPEESPSGIKPLNDLDSVQSWIT